MTNAPDIKHRADHTIADIEIFATCPQSSQASPETYLNQVIDVAGWSEHYGCKGILVYTDNSLADPWLVSQLILQHTTKLCPLIAVQPIYMHPYTAAKLVATYGFLFHRRIYLNMVAGGFKNDLNSLNDLTPHDQRYDRLVEYVKILKQLLASPAPVSYQGKFYQVDKLKMTPPLPSELFPGVFVSGSSAAGLAAAQEMGATPVRYPKPAGEYEQEPQEQMMNAGIRIGLVAREDSDEAWHIARERFPEDRKGQLTRQLASQISDSEWHKQLSGLAETPNPYWMNPFQNYQTNCPYLVGNYAMVAGELKRYIELGFRTFILDIPPNEEELYHAHAVFKLAAESAARKEEA